MSKNDLVKLLEESTLSLSPEITDVGSQIKVRLASSFEAEILTGCLQHMRNVDCTFIGNYVYIPLDESNYTFRNRAHDPEPRF